MACATLACVAGDVIVAVDEIRAPDKHFTAELIEQALRDAVAAVKAKVPTNSVAARAAGARSSTSNGSQAMRTSPAASRAIWRSTRQEHWAAGACWSPYGPLHRPRVATAGAHLAARTTHLAGHRLQLSSPSAVAPKFPHRRCSSTNRGCCGAF